MNMKKIQLFWLCTAFAGALVGCNQTPAASEPSSSNSSPTDSSTPAATKMADAPASKADKPDEKVATAPEKGATASEKEATPEKASEEKVATKTDGKASEPARPEKMDIAPGKGTPPEAKVLTPSKVTGSKTPPVKDRAAMQAENRKNADTSVKPSDFVGTWSKVLDEKTIKNWPIAKAAYLKKFPGKKFYDRKADLILKSDNTFTWVDEAGPAAYTSTGTWKLVKNEVTFTIKSVNGGAPKLDMHKKPFTAIMNKSGKAIMRNAAEEFAKK